MGVAHADDASTTGGIKIKSSDGNFDASLGGRIHFDGLLNMPDSNAHKIGSGAADDANSDFEFRACSFRWAAICTATNTKSTTT